MRAGQQESHDFFDLNDTVMTPESAAQAAMTWSIHDPKRTYFRFRSEHAVAVIDIDAGDSFWFGSNGDDEQPLHMPQRSAPRWEQRLAELVDAA